MKTKGLSLAEAHESGRKYRQVGDTCSYYRIKEGHSVSWLGAISLYELEPEAKLLTREEVEAALVSCGITGPKFRIPIIDALFGSEDV